MLRTRVIPCLLLRHRALVKTVRFRAPAYIGDPINTVRIFNEKEVDEIVFLDISATVEGTPINFDVLRDITSECFMPLAYGGGIRSLTEMQALFELGIEKVIVNTAACDCAGLLEQAAARFGSQSLIVSVDVRRSFFGQYRVVVAGGKRQVPLSLLDYVRRAQELGAGELLLTSVDRDGTFQGYDLELIRQVTAVTTIPVIACGGAAQVADFGRAVNEAGASAVAAGSMFVYQGRNRAVLVNFPTRSELKKVLA